MQRLRTSLGVCSAMTLLVLGFALADEESVPLDKVPKAVLDAVKARFKEAEVTEAAKETEDGKLVYEVTVKEKGAKIDVTLTPEGEILVIERTIVAKDLPAAVTRALEDKYPKAKYKIVEEVIKVEKKQEKLAYYEVLLETADQKKREVEVTAEGKIIHEEKKDNDTDE
jgi:uncharacterized membrane protein YkoI